MMTSRTFAALFLSFLSVVFCTRAAGEETNHATFRVMTYNIHHGEGLDKKVDLARIAELIKAEKADLVALQEVDRGIARSGKQDVAGEIARLAGMQCVFSNNFSFSGGEYGNAILSRFPIVERDHKLLKMVGSQEQRGWLKVVVDVHGRKLSFWNTHVDHRKEEAERLASVEDFKKWLKEETAPVIFCGDFNASPGRATYNGMKSVFDDTIRKLGLEPAYTIPVEKPTARIDYIWVSKGASIKPLKAWVPQTKASDHLPVVAEFDWN